MIGTSAAAPATASSPAASVSSTAEFWLRAGRDAPRLRIGVMVDSFEQIAAFAATLEHIERSDFADIVLVIVNALPPPPATSGSRPGLLTRVARVVKDSPRRKRLLYHLYGTYDRRRNPQPDDPLRSVDCTALLAGVEQLRVVPIVRGFTHRFTPEDVAAIQAARLDVILRYGFNIVKGDILKAARYGMWSYHHGDNDFYRGGPAYFWELVEGRPTSGVLLQVLNEELDAGQVLCKSLQSTRDGLWVVPNRVAPYWAGSSFVIQKLHELHTHGWPHLEQHIVPNAPYEGRRRPYRTPTNWEMVKFLAPRITRKILTRPFRRHADHQHWKIALRAGGRMLSPAAPDMTGFRWIEPPPGHFHADPVLFERGGKTWLFFEDYSYRDGKAIIACAEVLGDGGLAAPHTALARPHHLSFPFVFEDGGDVYMIPETGAQNTVELYRARRFPSDWEPVTVLFRGPHPVDTVVHRRDGLYWLFTSLIDPPATGPQLFLFWSDSLRGDWHPHPLNPITRDVRAARGAGAIFEYDGRLIRPSQDCSRCYGYAFGWNEVVRLTRTEYVERPLLRVGPAWSRGLVGTHSYARCGTVEAVDGAVLASFSGHRTER